LQGGASVSLPPSSAPSPSLFFLLSLKNIEGKSVYSHLSSPFFKNIEGRSVYSLSLSLSVCLSLPLPLPLSLFSYEIPLSLLKGSILRKYIEEAYRGKEAYPFHPLPTDFIPGVFARTLELFVWDDKQDKEHQNTYYYFSIIKMCL